MTGFFSGWGSSSDGLRERFGTLPERYTQYDLVLAWETKSLGSGTVIDGVVKNVRYAYLDGLEVWVEVLDASGKAAVRASCFIIPNRLRQDQMAPLPSNCRYPASPAPCCGSPTDTRAPKTEGVTSRASRSPSRHPGEPTPHQDNNFRSGLGLDHRGSVPPAK